MAILLSFYPPLQLGHGSPRFASVTYKLVICFFHHIQFMVEYFAPYKFISVFNKSKLMPIPIPAPILAQIYQPFRLLLPVIFSADYHFQISLRFLRGLSNISEVLIFY